MFGTQSQPFTKIYDTTHLLVCARFVRWANVPFSDTEMLQKTAPIRMKSQRPAKAKREHRLFVLVDNRMFGLEVFPLYSFPKVHGDPRRECDKETKPRRRSIGLSPQVPPLFTTTKNRKPLSKFFHDISVI